MDNQQMIAHIEKWAETGKAVEEQFGKLDALIGGSPDSPFRAAMWSMYDAYTATVAEIVGDNDSWLDWFAWDCDFGRKPKEIQFTDGETLLVVGPSDLLAAIRADENGNRVWW